MDFDFNEQPLDILPSLAITIGLNEAIFLQNLHSWLTPTEQYKPYYKEYKGEFLPWINNTYHIKENKDGNDTGWQADFPFWSTGAIKRIVSNLKERNLIICTDKFNDYPTDRTLWYTINYPEFSDLEISKTKDNSGFVYLILSETSACKIGRSKKPKKRVKAIRKTVPSAQLEYCFPADNMIDAEAKLHNRYDDKSLGHEWFDLSDWDILDIKSITKFENGNFHKE